MQTDGKKNRTEVSLRDNQYLAVRFRPGTGAKCSSAIGLNLNGTVSFAIDAWIRLRNFMDHMCIIGQRGIFEFGTEGRRLYFSFGDRKVLGETLLQRDDWIFVSMYYYEGEIGLYVDGEEDSILPLAGGTGSSSDDFLIGEEFAGDMRCIRIYDFPLTAYMMNQNKYQEPKQYVKAYFNLSSAVPSDTFNKHTITLGDNAERLLISRGLLFDGLSCIEASGDMGVNPGGYEDEGFTVQMQMYFDPMEEDEYTLLSNVDGMCSRGLFLIIRRRDKKYYASVLYGYLGENQYLLETEIETGKWMNLAVTYETGTMKVYIDGVVKAESKKLIPMAEWIEDNRCLIGASPEPGTDRSRYFSGLLGNLSVWRKALEKTDISKYMSQPPEGEEEGISACLNFLNNVPVNSATGYIFQSVSRPRMGEVAETNTSVKSEVTAGPEFLEPFSEEELKQFRNEILLQRKFSEEMKCAVTHHEKNGKLYFVLHTQEHSCTAAEWELAEDEITVWWIDFFIILIAAILDIVASVPIKTGSRLDRFIRANLLSNAKIRALFRAGANATDIARGIMKSVGYIIESGKAMAMLKAVGLNWWVIGNILANLIANYLGGMLGMITKAAVWLSNISAHIGKYPEKFSLKGIALDTVCFDHNEPNVADAISIKKNGWEELPDYVWSSAAAAKYSTAVYSAARVWKSDLPVPIAVKARFKYQVPASVEEDSTSVVLRCVETVGDLLGTSEEVTVNKKRELSAGFLFQFKKHQVGKNGITKKQVSLQWQIKEDNRTWKELITTQHTIYVLLDYPQAPWGMADSKVLSRPWTDVLDFLADKVEGLRTKTEVAQRLTKAVNQEYKAKYEKVGGASAYTGPDQDEKGERIWTVGIGDFMKNTAGRTVNCTDCATIVTTFANLYGCNLSTQVMSDKKEPELGFACNKILSIGWESEGWKAPFEYGTGGQGGFSYHEVAIDVDETEPSYNKGHKVYDACLKVNKGRKPWSEPREALLPEGMAFSAYDAPVVEREEVEEDSYREHLAANNVFGVGCCFLQEEDIKWWMSRRAVRTTVRTAKRTADARKAEKALQSMGIRLPEHMAYPYTLSLPFYEQRIPSRFCKVYRRGMIGNPKGYSEYYADPAGQEWIHMEVMACRDGKEAAYEMITKHLEMTAIPSTENVWQRAGIDVGLRRCREGGLLCSFVKGNLFVFIRAQMNVDEIESFEDAILGGP